ncbi:hypothetical protein [Methanobrevibacter sp.]|uniref:hypothetical protein n=1 Tax=Methanobrevibacter sp. TaxID=66852 RepID=UPI003866C9E5
MVNISAISANELDGNILTSNNQLEPSNGNQITVTPEQDLKQVITDADVNDVIILEPGTYTVHNVNITKNITLQGNGNPRDIIIDGEKKSLIFLVESQSVHARFNNITFINGVTKDYGGAISMYSGNVYLDNCHFINNTALKSAGGAIANFGIDNGNNYGVPLKDRKPNTYAYLFVNNSVFINNHADHDGGAITTDFANTDIYNTLFINNSAGRDGGAVRINREGHGNVQDCIFMFNSAKEWGGAYYSWVGASVIERCVFANNTAGTNGGAIMASANITIVDSIIVNNTGQKTGGALYIQQPMNKENAGFILKNNLITNNNSPLGKEIYVKWKETKLLFPYFNDNDWGDEDPNDPSIIDPDGVIISKRRPVSSTVESNLLNEMDMSLLKKYDDIIRNNFNINHNGEKEVIDGDTSNQNLIPISSNNQTASNAISNSSSQQFTSSDVVMGNSTTVGTYKNAYELNEKNSVVKEASAHIEYFLALSVIVFLALIIGYRTKSEE